LFKKKTKVLITGAAGYIGKNTVTFLNKKKSLDLILIDKKTKPKLKMFDSIKYIKFDLNDNLREKLIKIQPDIIIHLAALTSVTESEINKKIYYKNNFIITKNICNYCLEFNKKIVLASSAAVYRSKNIAIKENDNRKPKNFYGKTKFLSENFIINKFSRKGSYIILRFFNVAGGDKKNKITFSNYNFPVFKVLSLAIKNNRKFLIYGKNPKNDKTAIRDYIHVFDIAKIISLSIDHLITNKKNLILNCCNGVKTTILDLVKIFKKISKKNLRFEIIKKRKGEDFIFFGNNTKLKKELKIKLRYSLKKIVKDSYDSI